MELNAEEMMKLDIHIRNKENSGWRGMLLESIQHRETFESEARRYEAEFGVYIRPICVIQVERTERTQKTSGYIHTDDVREFLLRNPGTRPEHIVVKTSGRDELKEVQTAGACYPAIVPFVSSLPNRRCRKAGTAHSLIS